VACVQCAPSDEYHTSFFQLRLSLPPITQILPSKTTAVWSQRGDHGAESVADVQCAPFVEYQTSLLLAAPPMTHIFWLKTTDA